MTASPQLSPERLARLLDQAVGQVTPAPGTLDRIHCGVRRRRWLRRAGAVMLSAAVLAGAGVTVLTVAPGSGSAAPAGASSPPGTTLLLPAAEGAPASSPTGRPPRLAMMAPQDEPDAFTSAMDSDDVTDTGGPGRLATATIVRQSTGSFQLVVSLTTGATQTIAFSAAPAGDMPASGPVVIGWTSASGAGSEEIFVQVSRGCCTESWAIFRLVNGRLRQISLAGRPALLTVGGGPVSGGGFSCPGLDLVVYGYQARGSGAFLATTDTYRWAGVKLVLASHRQTTIHGTARSPQLARYQEVSCGSLDPVLGKR
jgi:hypothetical protein